MDNLLKMDKPMEMEPIVVHCDKTQNYAKLSQVSETDDRCKMELHLLEPMPVMDFHFFIRSIMRKLIDHEKWTGYVSPFSTVTNASGETIKIDEFVIPFNEQGAE